LDYACLLYNLTTIPFYETLGSEGIKQILNESKLETIFCSVEGASNLLNQENFFNLKTIVCISEFSAKMQERIAAKGLKLLSYSDLLKQGV